MNTEQGTEEPDDRTVMRSLKPDDRTVPRSSIVKPTGFLVRVDDGVEHHVSGRTFAGRAPVPTPVEFGGALVEIPDSSMSLSKTHALFDVVGGVLRVSDLGSTNGTVVVSGENNFEVMPGTWREVAVGDRVLLGDRWVEVISKGAPDVSPSASAGASVGPDVTSAVVVVPAPDASDSGVISVPPEVAASLAPPAAGPPTPGSVGPVSSGIRSCSACGATVAKAEKFCTSCGTFVSTGAERVEPHGGPLTPDHSAPKSTSKRSLPSVPILVGCVVGVLALIIVGALLLKRGDSSGTSAALPRLPTKPEERYSIDLKPSGEAFDFEMIGTPDRLAVTISGTHDELRLYNRDGEELWNHKFDDSAGLFPVGGDFLAVNAVVDEDSELTLLDGKTGDEVWSEEVSPSSTVFVLNNEAYVIDDGRVAVYSVSDGKKERSERFDRVSENAQTELATSGGFVVYDNDEVFVVNSSLKSITEPVSSTAGTAWYLNKQIVVSEDGELIRYGADGKERASDRFDTTYSLQAVNESTWLYQSDEGCGAIDFTSDQVEKLWDRDNCSVYESSNIGGKSYVVLNDNESSESLLVDAMTGDEDRSTEYGFLLLANGFLEGDDGRVVGFSLPDQEELFSERVDEATYFVWFDGGYALIESDNEDYPMTVFY